MYINGKYTMNSKPILVIDYIKGLHLNKYVTYIAINGNPVPMSAYETTYIHDEDHVEFAFTVSGG